VIGRQRIARTSRLEADPADALLVENLLTDAPVVGTEATLRRGTS
jgi:hypothetical protein